MRGTGSLALKRGAWAEEEDALLKKCIGFYGEGNWHKVPLRAGLNRCRKSCRLRWYNYLSPNIKQGEFGSDEIDLIMKMHKLLGNRWSLIAGRIPGRTANAIKNHWNSHIVKKLQKKQEVKTKTATHHKVIKVIKPKPLKFSNHFRSIKGDDCEKASGSDQEVPGNLVLEFEDAQSISWLEKLLFDEEDGKSDNLMAVSTDKSFTSSYADGVELTRPSQETVLGKEGMVGSSFGILEQ